MLIICTTCVDLLWNRQKRQREQDDNAGLREASFFCASYSALVFLSCLRPYESYHTFNPGILEIRIFRHTANIEFTANLGEKRKSSVIVVYFQRLLISPLLLLRFRLLRKSAQP